MSNNSGTMSNNSGQTELTPFFLSGDESQLGLRGIGRGPGRASGFARRQQTQG